MFESDDSMNYFIGSYNFGNHYNNAHNSWQSKRTVSWKPFKSKALKRELSSAPTPLTFRHHRLLIQDKMLLKKGDSVILLLCMDHPFLKDATSSNKWMELFQDGWKHKPSHPVQFQTSIYYSMETIVASNPNCNLFWSGDWRGRWHQKNVYKVWWLWNSFVLSTRRRTPIQISYFLG